MSANFLYSTNYSDALSKVVSLIGARKPSLDERHLLIVPEQYTLLAEKRLYEKCEGSFDIEVLSPSRLFYKMNISTPLLSREGAIMLIRGFLPSLELECFKKAAFYRGFCEKLYDAINDFAANGVAYDDIPSSTPKLRDLKLIYGEYLRQIEGRFVDSMGKLDLIARNVDTSEYLDNVHVYIANFDYVDSATRRVFDKLEERALTYTESVVKLELRDTKLKKLWTEKFRGEGAPAVKEVAKRLRYAAYKGVPYEDMAVIVGNAAEARIKRIFTEFGVPFFIAESTRLIDHPLPSFIIKLFDCAREKRRENMIELSKNLYMGIEKAEADAFEEYIYSHLIDRKLFDEPFKDSAECEATRQKVVSITEFASARIGKVTDAASLGAFIDELFAYLGAEKVTEDVFNSRAVIDKTLSLISLMAQVGIRGNFDFVSAVFVEGLKATKLSALPYEGGVVVGSPGAFRGGKYKFVALLGFDDGFLPQVYDDSSLIGDDEKECFTQMERAEEINLRYEAELFACLDSTESAFATYVEPSGMMDEIFASAHDVTLDEFDDGNAVFEAGCVKHATEFMRTLINRNKAGEERHIGLINALFVATGCDERAFSDRRVENVESGERLFFPDGRTSVSRLQSYFACPFRHFADYGLGIKRRDKGEVTALDVGDLMHKIAELVMRSGGDDIDAETDRAVERLKSQIGKLALPASADKLEELKNESKVLLKIFSSHLKKGLFVPIGQEIPFSVTLGKLQLVGKIDYADRYGDRIRLIDYKTGSVSVSLADVYYGNKIQLPIYMAAEEESGYKKGAVLMFPLHTNWFDNNISHRFSGFVLAGEDMANAMDTTYLTGDNEVFRLVTEKKKPVTDKSILTEEEFDDLVKYAIHVCENAADEIKSGYIAPSPTPKACSYCDYGCLCVNKRTRELPSVGKSAFKEQQK